MDRKPNGIRVAIETLGCKLNQAESELLARQMAEAGFRLVSPGAKADVYILNTCTVTHIADRKARHRLRMARRLNPGAVIVATGCYVQRAREEIRQIEGVDIVLANDEKPNLLGLLNGLVQTPHQEIMPIESASGGWRTRSFIKIQDGCNTPCAYCIVPAVRGGEKSLSPEQILSEIKERLAEGYLEIVLTGTKVGSYNYVGVNLAGLLGKILGECNLPRLRLSSLQPGELTPELISLWKDERLCPHLHPALQSGSDSVLQRMNRCYNTTEYRQALSLIRSELPDAAITTDVIVGFPGETEAEFEESYRFYREMEFARIHVFPYSPRQGTPAARMPEKVPDNVKKQRVERMLALANESARSFRQRFLGKTITVLWERETNGYWSGYTGNYIKVYTRSTEDLTNKLLPVKLLELKGDGVVGEFNSSSSS